MFVNTIFRQNSGIKRRLFCVTIKTTYTMPVVQKIKSNPNLKKFVHWCLVPKHQARPRLWVKLFVNPFYHKKGKGVTICRRTRMDVLPFQPFSMGNYSTVEDFATVNNGVGPVHIGSN